jgi:hypothetical protein
VKDIELLVLRHELEILRRQVVAPKLKPAATRLVPERQERRVLECIMATLDQDDSVVVVRPKRRSRPTHEARTEDMGIARALHARGAR